MDGKFKLSCGNKTHGLCAATYCIFVALNFHPGIVKNHSDLCHLGSKPHSHSLGNPTPASRSVTLITESFSAMKLKTLFDSPDCTGITRHPLTKFLTTIEPLGRSPTFTIRLLNKKSFVRNKGDVDESPISRDNTKCGFSSIDLVKSNTMHIIAHAIQIPFTICFLNLPTVNL